MLSLLKLLPTCSPKPLSKFLPLDQLVYKSFSVTTNSLQFISDGFGNKNRVSDFDFLFRSCTKVDDIKQLHALLVVLGKFQNVFLYAKLVNLYAYLGDVSFSRYSFNQIQKKDVHTWNSMVAAYVRSGQYNEALKCFSEFLSTSGLHPDFYTLPPVLKACKHMADGKKIHYWVFKIGLEQDVFVTASLIHLYAWFGALDAANKLFVDMPIRDLGCWNAMISGFCLNENLAGALEVLNNMKAEGVNMDPITVSSLLPVCAQSNDIINGILIHSYVIKQGLETHMFVSNSLINMYSKFGYLRDAQRVFDHMKVRDLVTWNSIIAAYEQNNDPIMAFEFYKDMQLIGIQIDLLTVVSLASIFAQLSNIKHGRSVHGFVLRHDWIEKDVVIGNALVNMYAKLGAMDHSWKVFELLPIKDVVSWNTLIAGYAQNGLASGLVLTT